MKNFFSAIVAMFVILFALVTPAFAKDGTEVLTPLYGVGVGEVSAPSAAAEICRQWQSCEAARVDCDIVVEASTSNNEHVVRSRGTSFEYVDEAALGYARQANLVQQIQTACPASASDLDIKIGPTWPHKQPSLSYRYAWATVKPAVDRAVLDDFVPPPTACNDGKDNDTDGKTDMADPGCETPDDQSEWNAKPIPADPNVRWVDLAGVIVAEAATPCPVSITGWWEIDPQDKEYHFHYKVDHGYCPLECRTSDVSATMPGYQMRSPAGTAKSAISLPDPLVTADVKGKLTWTILRTHIEAPERAPGIEYVDASGAEDKTMWFGRAADVTDRGDLIIIDFKSVCDDLIMAELEQEYTGTDFVVLGAGSLTASVLGDGSSLTTHPAGTLVAEFGIETGTAKAAFLGTVGFGGYFDDNCAMPAAWLAQGRFGGTFNRSGTVGLIVDGRIQYSFGPSYVIYPDDPETEENEYTASPALGTNAAAFLVDIGPRIAFGRGVHKGWIAPTLTAGPKLRWFEPTSGDQRVTLTADFGGTLAVGFDW